MIVGITRGEYLEYLQNGCIAIKDYPVSFHAHNYRPEFKQIDFESILDSYKLKTEISPSASYGEHKRMILAVEFGLIRVEDFGENYLLEVIERGFNDDVIERLKQKGYEAEEAGHFRLINVKKKTRG